MQILSESTEIANNWPRVIFHTKL